MGREQLEAGAGHPERREGERVVVRVVAGEEAGQVGRQSLREPVERVARRHPVEMARGGARGPPRAAPRRGGSGPASNRISSVYGGRTSADQPWPRRNAPRKSSPDSSYSDALWK